jgi:hypothetical protein
MTYLLFYELEINKPPVGLAEVKERIIIMDVQFRFAFMAAEEVMRAQRGQQIPVTRGAKRIFRLPSVRLSQRESGRR